MYVYGEKYLIFVFFNKINFCEINFLNNILYLFLFFLFVVFNILKDFIFCGIIVIILYVFVLV